MTSQINTRGRSASPSGFYSTSHHPDWDMFNNPHDSATPSASLLLSPSPHPFGTSNSTNQPGLLDPGRASRSSFASMNPFSSSSRSRSADPSTATGSGPKSLFSRALSRMHKAPAGGGQHPPPSTDTKQSIPPPSTDTEQSIPPAPPPAYTESTQSTAYTESTQGTAHTESTQSTGTQSTAPSASHRYANGAHPPPSARNASTEEDRYAFLSNFDTVFLIDDSGSMAGRSWGETQRALASIVPICVAHDMDGVDVYFLNHSTRDTGDPLKGTAGTGFRGVRSLAEVETIFSNVRPSGATPTGTRLYKILGPYLKYYARRVKETGDETCLKPLNVIVITDGAPSDDPDDIIVNFAKKLDDLDAPPYQVGIQFFQVGNEPGAAEKLRQLDDEISSKVAGGVRDMVDTATFDAGSGSHNQILTGDGILKAVLGAVVRRLDRVKSNLRG